MSSSALLTLIALVASIDGSRATVEGELVHYLRPADVGRVQYVVNFGNEPRMTEAGTAEVVSVQDGTAVVELTSDRQVQRGFEVRFELPFERVLAQAELEATRKVEARLAAKAEPVTVRRPFPTPAQLESRVLAWADAWSSQDPPAYLSFYTTTYEPDGTSRQQWEAERGERLRAPRFIEITIEAFELLSSTVHSAEVRFEQGYRSDTYQDRVTKMLELVLVDGEWRILREEAQ